MNSITTLKAGEYLAFFVDSHTVGKDEMHVEAYLIILSGERVKASLKVVNEADTYGRASSACRQRQLFNIGVDDLQLNADGSGLCGNLTFVFADESARKIRIR